MYNIYIAILAICFICSLISFRLHYAFHLKLFSALIGISLLTEILASHANSLFHLKRNYLIYNVFMLIEYSLYALYFNAIMLSSKVKAIIKVFIFIFPVIWMVITLLVFGINGWNSYVLLIGDLFTVCMCAIYFYELFVSKNLIDFTKSPEFWIAAGTFIYCCCELPITGMLNFLAAYSYSLTGTLENVLQILNILMYLIFIYAFLCPLLINTTKPL